MSSSRSRGERNVLLIVVDQWRGDCLGVLGHPAVKTPNLDRFAREAVTFKRHYSQGAPCGPARASLLTGLYVMNHRVVTNGVPLDARHPTLSAELRRAGYEPTIVGYTTTTPDPRTVSPHDPRFTQIGNIMEGWKVFAHFDEDDFRNYFAWVAARGHGLPEDFKDIWLPASGQPGPSRAPSRIPAELSDSAWSTDRGIECMEMMQRRPWALHLGYYRPHPPLVAPAPYHDFIDEARIPAPLRAASPAEEAAQHPALRHYVETLPRRKFFRRAEGLVADMDDDAIRVMRKAYYGLIAEVDAQLGRVFDYLKKTRQWDNTLIVFTSDHAEQLGDHYLMGKELYFDQSYHVPLMIRDPDGAAHGSRGQVIDRMTEAVDLMPTILDWLGRPAPRACDGRSLMSWLRGPAPTAWSEEVHYEFDLRPGYPDPSAKIMGLDFDAGGMVVLQDRQWKYVHFQSLPPLLFDLARDPGQFRNLAQDPAHAPVLAAYAQRMLNWRMRHADRTLTHLCSSANGLYDRRRRELASAAD
jgi:arylsulfatase A-like enzyme